MIERLLEDVGLTSSEVKVYLALIKLGSTSVGAIIETSGVASSKIYELLERLIKKGLASYITENGVRVYSPADPDQLLVHLEEKEEQLHAQKEEVRSILPQLRAVAEEEMGDAAIYKGHKGLRTAFEEALAIMPKDSVIHVIGVPAISRTDEIFFAKWNKKRAKQDVGMRIVFEESARGSVQALKKNLPNAKVRYLPKNIVTPTAINIFNDRVLLNVVGDSPLIIVLRGSSLVKSFMSQFELQWDGGSLLKK